MECSDLKKCGKTAAIGLLCSALSAGYAFAKEPAKTMQVVFTHDIHSYLNSYQIEENGITQDVGGAARLGTLLKEKRQEDAPLLVLDAGDFSMGTLFHTLFTTQAIEYRTLGLLGYDAVTFGNHEFDFESQGLASMLNAAADQGEPLPPFLVCNVDWSSEAPGSKAIYEAVRRCGLSDYQVFRKGDVSAAVIGVFGKDSLECAPTCELTILDQVESVKNTVKEIQEKESVDLIVCISHGGTWSNAKDSEDEILAKAVPELDLIISGHTHTTLDEPIIHGDTAIVSCGAYGRYAGTLSMEQKENGRWSLEQYQLIPLDEKVEKDEQLQQILDSFNAKIDQDYLSYFGYTADQVLAVNEIDFEDIYQLEWLHQEHALGNILSDAFRYAANRAESGEIPVDVSVVPAGVVRGTFQKGNVTVADVFASYSLGSGPDGLAGYPLISVYLTEEELRTAAEVDASISDSMTTARLYMSGLCFSFNPSRMILDRVTDISLNPGLLEEERQELKNDRLYRLVTDLYTGRMLGAVSEKSMGILKIVPKHADGTKVEDLEDCILYDENGTELKAWAAIAQYMESFGEEGAPGKIPQYYAASHGRKVMESSKAVGDLLKNPGKYGRMIYGAITAVAAGITAVAVAIVKLFRRRKK